MLVGVTMTEDEQRLFGGVLPLDDVDSGAIDLAGRFAELVDRLAAALDALREPKTIDAVGGGDRRGGRRAHRDDASATPGSARELQRLLDDVVGEAGEATDATLALAEVRALLADRLQGRPTRANFRTGHLTICTLVPMRSVPHRVVCLLGLDDGVFPRKAPRDGDDLMLDDPHVGDRDPRTEDRQLLLDALLAASDRLIVTYTGNDERTNIAAPAGGAGRRAARRRRPHGPHGRRRAGARARRRPPPAPAVRPAQLHRGRARAATARGASTASRSRARAR